MTVYDSTVSRIGRDICDGLNSIAGAIKSKNTYIVNVIVAPGSTTEDVEQKVQQTLERVEARASRAARD